MRRHWLLVVTVLVLHLLALAAGPSRAEPAGSVEVRGEIERLRSADPKERAAAADRLGSPGLREHAAAAAPYLIKLLTDHPPTQHPDDLPYGSPAWWAVESLTKIGGPAMPELTAALHNPSEQIRARAAEALGRIGDPGPKPKLLALLNDSSPVVRGRAALALGRIGGPDVLEPLLAAAKDGHTLVQRRALGGLRILKDPRAVEPLLALLTDPNYRNSADVCLALGASQDKRAVEPLIALLQRPAPWYPAAALAEIGDRRAVEPLIALLDDPHDSARMAAVHALVHLRGGPKAYAAIVRVMKSKDLRGSVVEALAKAGDAAVPVLADALCSQDPDIQEGAAQTLRKTYGEQFDHGGREWFVWLRESPGALAAWENLPAVQSRPPDPAAQRKLVRTAELGIPGQTQVMRLLAAGDKLFASVRYHSGMTPAANGDGIRERMVAEIRTALVAWDASGSLLWKTDLPFACHLLMVGNQIVLAYDAGGLNSPRGLIWIDSASGRQLRHIELPGRPGKLAFNPRSETLVMILYPQHRLETTRDAWMEVRSYQMDSTLAWVHKEPFSELEGICLEGTAIVIGSTAGADPFVAGLDPLSGKPLWRRRWGWFPAIPEAGTKTPGSLSGLACIPKREGLEVLAPAHGATVHALPRPKGHAWVPKRCGHTDRLYFTSTGLEGFTLAAMAFPSGKALWADQTATVCYGEPVDWQGNTVFLLRRLSEGLTGGVTLVELRIYSPEGRLLSHLAKEQGDPSGFWDDCVQPQAAGKRLYLAEGSRIVALEWAPDAE